MTTLAALRSPARHPLRAILPQTLTAIALLAGTASAQCGFQWHSGFAARGPLGEVRALARMPNGDLVAGGDFVFADRSRTNHIARWNGTEWLPLGAGFDQAVTSLAVLPNGDLIAGGMFNQSGSTPVGRVARWTGSAWAPLGGGTDGLVEALAVLPNGDLIAGGTFAHAGAAAIPLVARWDGLTWSSLGAGLTPVSPGSAVIDLTVTPNGDVHAVGYFGVAGSSSLSAYVSFDGTTWNDHTLTLLDFPDHAVARPNGHVLLSSTTAVYEFDGTVTTQLGTASNLTALTVDPAGNPIVSSSLFGGYPQSRLFQWSGATWVSFGVTTNHIWNCLLADVVGHVVAGGSVTTQSYSPVSLPESVQDNDGVSWQTVGNAHPAAPVTKFTTLRNGDVVATGSFTEIEGQSAQGLAHWDGAAWHDLGTVEGTILDIAEAPNGDLVVVGTFTAIGGVPVNHVARWDGSTWSPLGPGLASANKVAVSGTGEVVALSGVNLLSSWHGTAWSTIPIPPTMLAVLALTTLADGRIVAGGLSAAGQSLQVWSAGVWQSIAAPNTTAVTKLVALPDGGLLAVANGIRLWDGSTWTALPGASVLLGYLPNGNPVAGNIAGNQSELLQFDGAAWVPFATLGNGASFLATSFAAGRNGDLFVGGSFTTVDQQFSPGFAHGQPTCPANALSFGSGCAGSAGVISQHAADLPWLGGALTATVDGLAASSLAVFAVAANLNVGPLPFGGPGCSLYVNPLWLELLTASAGSATAQVAIPATPSLTGLTFASQAIALEFGAGGTSLQTASSNALLLVVGSL